MTAAAGDLGVRLWLWTLVGLQMTCVLTRGHLCDVCEPERCPLPEGDCEWGLVPDPCDCCLTCALGPNATCGGQYGILGRCATGLTCTIGLRPGDPITGHEVGTCQPEGEIPDRPQLDCDLSTCNSVRDLRCPDDSQVTPGPPTPGQDLCCPANQECTCRPCDLADLSCDLSQVRVIHQEGTGLPGTCCDVVECIDKSVFCSNVTCDADLEEPYDWLGWEGSGDEHDIVCPPDSVLLPPVDTKHGCCRRQQGCACGPQDQCRRPLCEEGTHAQVIAPATGRPGFCCDQLQCTNKTSLPCVHQNRPYEHGSVWHQDQDKCTTCSCHEGLVFCSRDQCEVVSPGCSWVGIPEDQCCPVCRGCVMEDGGRYPLNATWDQDECTTCTCIGGRAQCQTASCAINCAHPKKVPGRCCPVCEGETSVTLAPHCPLLSNCSILCPHGMETDAEGCYLCSCRDGQIEPTRIDTDCELDCPKGYVIDDQNNILCECVQPQQCPVLKNCDKDCMYGYRINSKGCKRCRCNKCPPFVCKKKCRHGYKESHRGCQLCRCRAEGEATTIAPPPTLAASNCMANSGRQREDGESWHDGCRRCFCYEGHEMCAMITCPVPQCQDPLIKQGDCCPSCSADGAGLSPGLTTRCSGDDGNSHIEGELWTLDECTRCICHKGGVLCEIETCPPVLCHHPIKLPNTCCLVCPDASNQFALSEIPGRKSCVGDTGTKINHGDSWRVNACQSCTCSGGQIHCFSQTCPLLSCNKTIVKKGQCCPICLEDEPIKLCIHEGSEYESGESWLLGECTRCVCEKGTAICTNIQCPPLDMCTHLIHVLGRCCPVCLNATLEPVLPNGDDDYRGWNTPPPPRFTDNTLDGVLERVSRSQRVTVAVLVGLILLLCAVVMLLLLLLLRTRRKTHHSRHKRLNPHHMRHRPKSTNVDFQGVSPLPPGVKTQNCDKGDQNDVKMTLDDLPQVRLVNGEVLGPPSGDKPSNMGMSHDNKSCNLSP